MASIMRGKLSHKLQALVCILIWAPEPKFDNTHTRTDTDCVSNSDLTHQILMAALV